MTKQVTLENTLPGGFGLPGGIVVPGSGSISVEPEIWDEAKGHPVVKARVDAGTLIVDGKGKKAAEPSADVATLQARNTELEALLKTAKDEITALKAGNGGQGSAGNDGATTYTVKEQSPGWHAIVGGDGKVLTKNFRADDLKDFADLDADKQKAFVEANKAD
jgi:hypothetical protein